MRARDRMGRSPEACGGSARDRMGCSPEGAA
jgi:hypothetical protein